MIYQDVKRYLKRSYQTPSKDYKWNGHDNFKLLNYIQSKYSDEYIQNNASEIKQAFRDFYEPISSIIIRFKLDTGVTYKVIPYHVDPKNSKHLNNIVDIIRKNRRAIEYPYQGRDDQIALLGKIRRSINSEIIETDEAVNKKELVRYAIKIALDLDDRDVVVHLKRKYIIKLFKKNEFLNSDAKEPAQKDTSEKRFQGYNAEDLASHYDELVDDIDIGSFLDNVMAILFASKLDFQEITNNYFEANVLLLVRNAIAEELKQYVSENEDYVTGLAGYIFRNNFEAVHQRIAIEIFEQVSAKNKNAEHFLSYYSGTILIENGKKYIIPELSTPDGRRWNIASISATAIMWLRSRHEENKIRVELDNVNNDYIKTSTEYEIVSAEYKKYMEDMSSYKDQLEKLEKNVLDIRTNFKLKEKASLSQSDTTDLSKAIRQDQQKIIIIKEKIVKLEPVKSEFYDKAKNLKIKHMELKDKKQSLDTSIRTLQKNLDINSNAFNSILGSLVKALMQRKKLVIE